MGAIGGPLGLSGGAAGSGFAGPQEAKTPVTFDPSMQQQQALRDALSSQNGMQNQNQVYGQLQGIINGTGPNPAQAALNQNTAANVAQTGALMAGQRGASQNVGLMARNAGMAGGQLQQQAVGQAATLQAQQAQNAINAASGIADTQVKNQIGQTNAVQNANQALYNSRIGMQSNINQGNAGFALQEMQQGQSAMGGSMNGAGSAMSLMAAAKGGEVKGYADGGDAFSSGPQSEFGQYIQTVNAGGNYFSPNSVMQPAQPQQPQQKKKKQPGELDDSGQGIADATANQGNALDQSNSLDFSSGGMVDVMVSPGEEIVYPDKVKKAAGGNVDAKTVPGKAKVAGDDYKNDTVKTKLPEGTIIVPRTMSKNKKDSASFVAAQLAKRRGRK